MYEIDMKDIASVAGGNSTGRDLGAIIGFRIGGPLGALVGAAVGDAVTTPITDTVHLPEQVYLLKDLPKQCKP